MKFDFKLHRKYLSRLVYDIDKMIRIFTRANIFIKEMCMNVHINVRCTNSILILEQKLIKIE